MKFIIFSWADGIGKSYLMENIKNILWFEVVPMITTRPRRNWDDKISTDYDEFTKLSESVNLFWVHRNLNWYFYWYSTSVFWKNGIWLLEINPVYQKYSDIVDLIENNWWTIIHWFWLISEEGYLMQNIKNRNNLIDEEQLDLKLKMWREIQNNINEISTIGDARFKVVNITFANRDTLLMEILNYVNQIA